MSQKLRDIDGHERIIGLKAQCNGKGKKEGLGAKFMAVTGIKNSQQQVHFICKDSNGGKHSLGEGTLVADIKRK